MNDVANAELESDRLEKEKQAKWFHLKDKYTKLFRYNLEQGLFGECLIPIAFQYVMGTFTLNWMLT